MITARVVAGSSLPTDIFIYENVFTPPQVTSLGEFLGVCNVNELTRLRSFTGEYTPIFGNKFLKYSEAKIEVSSGEDIETTILGLANDVKKLSYEYAANISSSRIINV